MQWRSRPAPFTTQVLSSSFHLCAITVDACHFPLLMPPPPSLLLHSRRLFSSAARMSFPPDFTMPNILSDLSHS
jgi:hypothetical protein